MCISPGMRRKKSLPHSIIFIAEYEMAKQNDCEKRRILGVSGKIPPPQDVRRSSELLVLGRPELRNRRN